MGGMAIQGRHGLAANLWIYSVSKPGLSRFAPLACLRTIDDPHQLMQFRHRGIHIAKSNRLCDGVCIGQEIENLVDVHRRLGEMQFGSGMECVEGLYSGIQRTVTMIRPLVGGRDQIG